MLNVTEATKTAYKNDSVHKVLTISFPNVNVVYTNNDIVLESLEIEESINSEEYLTFKGCIATMLKFKCAVAMQDLRGQYVEVTIKASNTEVVPLFKGYVDKQTNLSHQDILTEITAYDELYKLTNMDVMSWYNNLHFPMTVLQFRTAFFSQIGITQESTTLPNDNLSLSKSITTSTLNALDVAKWICQANARFGKIGRDGTFKYVSLKEITEGLYPEETLYPSEDLYPADEGAQDILNSPNYTSLRYEPYSVQKITYVKIFDAQNAPVGHGANQTNVWCIVDNPIAYGLIRNTASINLYDEVKGLFYTPAEITGKGLPYLETGDTVAVLSRTQVVQTYILSRTLKGIQAITDVYTGLGEEYQPQYKETADSRNLAQERSERLSNEEGTRVSLDLLDDRIIAEVSRATDKEGELSSRLEQTATGFELTATNGSTSSRLTLKVTKEDGSYFNVTSNNITFNGMVTFSDLETAGSTYINGDNIETGTISGNGFSLGLDNGSKNYIGGFQIDNSRIMTNEADVSSSHPGTCLRGDNSGTYSLAIGYTSYTSYASAPFRVTHNGTFYATNAHISGEISADSGTIGGFNIRSMQIDTASDADPYHGLFLNSDNSTIRLVGSYVTSISSDGITTKEIYADTINNKDIQWIPITISGSNYYVLVSPR